MALNHIMPILCATRFNSDTFKEYEQWIYSENNINKLAAIYNTPVKISEIIFENETLYILEMNNTRNTIEGIGIIKNKCIINRENKIYSDRNYNRYSYKGIYRIKRTDLKLEDEKIFKILDQLLFKGSRHFKRGHGIQQLPKWILNNTEFNFTEFCKTLFQSYFTNLKM